MSRVDGEFIEFQEFLENAVRKHLSLYEEQNTYVKMVIKPTKYMESILPPEAFVEGNFRVDFNYTEGTDPFLTDQIEIKDGFFFCMVVYQGVDGWDEYHIEFPLENILLMTDVQETKEVPGASDTFLDGISKEQIEKSMNAFISLGDKLIHKKKNSKEIKVDNEKV